MFFILLIIKLSTISICAGYNVDPAPLEPFLSADTYQAFNMSKEYKKFNLSEFDALANNTIKFTRRSWDHQKWYYYKYPSYLQVKNPTLEVMGCFLNAQTYLLAYEDIKKYYHIRFLYENNLSYEIGYLVHEIISKYQMMLELYQLTVRKFIYAPNKVYAPVPYMMYIYSNILEYGMTVIHLCNMLHELPKKYEKKKKLSVFDNFEMAQKGQTAKRYKPPASTVERPNYEKQVVEIEEQLEEEKRERQRKYRKERKEAMKNNGWKPPAKNNTQKSYWPLHYGWSIEFW